MNRFYFVMLFMALANLVFAQEIKQTYVFDKFDITQKEGYQLISFEKSYLSGKIGEPMLPYHAVKLLLPQGTDVASLEFIPSDEIEMSGNFTIYPQQAVRPISMPNEFDFIKNQDIYNTDKTLPAKIGENYTVQYLNGYAVLLTSFTPITYNPKKEKISYYSKVEIRIKLKNQEKSIISASNLTSNVEKNNFVRKYVDNPEQMISYPQKKSQSTDYHVLILTSNTFKDNFQSLTNLYNTRGLRNKIVTTEFIQSSSTGQDLAEKIRNFIISEYQNYSISYVVLGGDVEIIPYRGFYAQVQSSTVQTDNNIPSDLYYAALDGNWNTNGNDKWGEPGEDDLLPELGVGRLSFSSLTELNNIINKTVNYQNTPIQGNLNRPLLVSEELWQNPLTYGGDYLNLLIGTHDDNGYTTTGIPESHPIVKLYDELLPSEWTASQLISQINTGHSFIHHCGHSNYNYAMRLYNSDITTSNFNSLDGTSKNFTLIYTHGCICGAFDENDCIGEEMVKLNRFAVGFVGNSRYGWFNEGQTEGPSAHLHREFINALYTDKENHLGMTHTISKIETAPWVTAPGQYEEGALRWCFYDCNVLADPTLAVWTDNPFTPVVNFAGPAIIGQQNAITVTYNSSPLEGFVCTIIKNDTILGTAKTNAQGIAQVELDPISSIPGEAQLVVTGYNGLKTTSTISLVYAQNCLLVLTNHSINDGNNNIPESGENCGFNFVIKNAGLSNATNISATVSTDDNYLTPSYSNVSIAIIEGSATHTIVNDLPVAISGNIPDMHKANLNLNLQSDQENKNISFSITIYAPVLSIGCYNIVEITGNANGVLEPGETGKLIVPVYNTGHATSQSGTINLSTTNPHVSISQSSLNLSSIEQGSSTSTEFLISFDNSLEIGTLIDFTSYASAGSYTANISSLYFVGKTIEDFETGDFSKLEWQLSGNQNWQITNSNVYSGTYSAKSGTITDDQTSELSITINVVAQGDIKFWKKVSCEDGYSNNWDYLVFLIDGQELDRWDGEVAWSSNQYPITNGEHILTWKYKKDGSLASGSDCAWLDNIEFPPLGSQPIVNIENNENQINSQIKVYPNPATDNVSFYLNPDKNENINITIISTDGKTVWENKTNNTDVISWNCKNSESGIYFYRIIYDGQIITGKIIKQ